MAKVVHRHRRAALCCGCTCGQAPCTGGSACVRAAQQQGSHKRVINELLRPRTWKAPEDRRFLLTAAVRDVGAGGLRGG